MKVAHTYCVHTTGWTKDEYQHIRLMVVYSLFVAEAASVYGQWLRLYTLGMVRAVFLHCCISCLTVLCQPKFFNQLPL